MAAGGGRSMEETATWAVAVVCFVLVLISIAIEQGIHRIGSWLKKKQKTALHEALEKIKAELMLMGFISLLLTVLQKPISEICISSGVADSWNPCVSLDDDQNPKIYEDKYCAKGKAPLMSTDAIHELHIFIFVLAFFHVLYCITTLALGKLKMRRWKTWEDETKSVEYQFSNDPERIRFTRETSFGRRHMTFWSRSTTFVWIVCFFRQFFKSVTRVDYLTLRQGFIAAHLAPGSDKSFDFRKYISRSLDEDFKVVVGISPIMWLFATLFLLGYTNGWYSYYWLPFMPLIIILLVGTKLQLIITELGLRISERAEVVKGTIVVNPDDDLFWFSQPRFLLFLIHFVLFQNAFQLAFFVFTWYKYGFRSCFHHKIQDVIIRLAMGLMIHILCSYITLPLYALVTQMGSTMKPTVFSARVAQAIKSWHRSIRNKKSHHYDRGTTPIMADSSWDDDSATPSVGSSPMHLLHGNVNRSERLEAPPSSPPLSEKNYWQFRNNGQGGFGYHDDPYSIDVVVSSPPPDIQLGRMEMEPRVSPVQLRSSRLVGDSSRMGQPEAPQDQRS